MRSAPELRVRCSRIERAHAPVLHAAPHSRAKGEMDVALRTVERARARKRALLGTAPIAELDPWLRAQFDEPSAAALSTRSVDRAWCARFERHSLAASARERTRSAARLLLLNARS